MNKFDSIFDEVIKKMGISSENYITQPSRANEDIVNVRQVSNSFDFLNLKYTTILHAEMQREVKAQLKKLLPYIKKINPNKKYKVSDLPLEAQKTLKIKPSFPIGETFANLFKDCMYEGLATGFAEVSRMKQSNTTFSFDALAAGSWLLFAKTPEEKRGEEVIKAQTILLRKLEDYLVNWQNPTNYIVGYKGIAKDKITFEDAVEARNEIALQLQKTKKNLAKINKELNNNPNIDVVSKTRAKKNLFDFLNSLSDDTYALYRTPDKPIIEATDKDRESRARELSLLTSQISSISPVAENILILEKELEDYKLQKKLEPLPAGKAAIGSSIKRVEEEIKDLRASLGLESPRKKSKKKTESSPTPTSTSKTTSTSSASIKNEDDLDEYEEDLKRSSQRGELTPEQKALLERARRAAMTQKRRLIAKKLLGRDPSFPLEDISTDADRGGERSQLDQLTRDRASRDITGKVISTLETSAIELRRVDLRERIRTLNNFYLTKDDQKNFFNHYLKYRGGQLSKNFADYYSAYVRQGLQDYLLTPEGELKKLTSLKKEEDFIRYLAGEKTNMKPPKKELFGGNETAYAEAVNYSDMKKLLRKAEAQTLETLSGDKLEAELTKVENRISELGVPVDRRSKKTEKIPPEIQDAIDDYKQDIDSRLKGLGLKPSWNNLSKNINEINKQQQKLEKQQEGISSFYKSTVDEARGYDQREKGIGDKIRFIQDDIEKLQRTLQNPEEYFLSRIKKEEAKPNPNQENITYLQTGLNELRKAKQKEQSNRERIQELREERQQLNTLKAQKVQEARSLQAQYNELRKQVEVYKDASVTITSYEEFVGDNTLSGLIADAKRKFSDAKTPEERKAAKNEVARLIRERASLDKLKDKLGTYVDEKGHYTRVKKGVTVDSSKIKQGEKGAITLKESIEASGIMKDPEFGVELDLNNLTPSDIRKIKEYISDQSVFIGGGRTKKEKDWTTYQGSKDPYEYIARIASYEVSQAYNIGRLEAYKAAGIQQVQWISILDTHTSVYCSSLNGYIFTIEEIERMRVDTTTEGFPNTRKRWNDSKKNGGGDFLWLPPAHPHCRSFLQPVPLKEDVEDPRTAPAFTDAEKELLKKVPSLQRSFSTEKKKTSKEKIERTQIQILKQRLEQLQKIQETVDNVKQTQQNVRNLINLFKKEGKPVTQLEEATKDPDKLKQYLLSGGIVLGSGALAYFLNQENINKAVTNYTQSRLGDLGKETIKDALKTIANEISRQSLAKTAEDLFTPKAIPEVIKQRTSLGIFLTSISQGKLKQPISTLAENILRRPVSTAEIVDAIAAKTSTLAESVDNLFVESLGVKVQRLSDIKNIQQWGSLTSIEGDFITPSGDTSRPSILRSRKNLQRKLSTGSNFNTSIREVESTIQRRLDATKRLLRDAERNPANYTAEQKKVLKDNLSELERLKGVASFRLVRPKNLPSNLVAKNAVGIDKDRLQRLPEAQVKADLVMQDLDLLRTEAFELTKDLRTQLSELLPDGNVGVEYYQAILQTAGEQDLRRLLTRLEDLYNNAESKFGTKNLYGFNQTRRVIDTIESNSSLLNETGFTFDTISEIEEINSFFRGQVDSSRSKIQEEINMIKSILDKPLGVIKPKARKVPLEQLEYLYDDI